MIDARVCAGTKLFDNVKVINSGLTWLIILLALYRLLRGLLGHLSILILRILVSLVGFLLLRFVCWSTACRISAILG